MIRSKTKIVSFVESDIEEDEDRRIEYLKYVLRYLQGLEAIKWEEAKEKLNPLKMTSQVMDVYEDLRIEGRQEGIAIGIEENKYHASYKMLKQELKLPFISDVMDVSIGFLENLQKSLVHEPKIIALLKKGKKSNEEIATQFKVSVQLVKAIKKEMEKNKN